MTIILASFAMRLFWLVSTVALVTASTRTTQQQLEASAFTRSSSSTTTPTTAFVFPKKASSSLSTSPPTATASLPAPPTGAVYQKTLPIPVIGRQSFRLHILSHDRAHLRVDGMLKIDEVLHYRIRSCGAFSLLHVPERLQKVLRRFRTQLIEFGYDRATDLPYVVVSPPIPTRMTIHLDREEPVVRHHPTTDVVGADSSTITTTAAALPSSST